MAGDVLFKNREDAAEQLTSALRKYYNKEAIVMAVPRGGVPVGAVIASKLHLPLNIILVKKIGHPMNPEYAIGSVSLNNVALNRNAEQIPHTYIDAEVAGIQKELKRRQVLFTGSDSAPSVNNKTIILTDDGIATGSTLLAAIRDLRSAGAGKIIVAVPVAPPSAVATFSKECDEFICLHTPPDFSGVGQFYEDFSQVTDEEAADILQHARGIEK